jgi:hypothetical protein
MEIQCIFCESEKEYINIIYMKFWFQSAEESNVTITDKLTWNLNNGLLVLKFTIVC